MSHLNAFTKISFYVWLKMYSRKIVGSYFKQVLNSILFCVKLQRYKIMKIERINYLIEFTSIVVKMGLSWHVWCINKNVVQNKRNRELWLANPLQVRHFFYKSLYTSTIASDLFSPSILQIFLKQSSTSECRYRARRGRKKMKHWPRHKL